jgi:hypothetical protein
MVSSNEQFEGHCCGGPYDGNWLIAPERRHIVGYKWEPTATPEILYGSYRHNLGQWIWSTDDVAHPG